MNKMTKGTLATGVGIALLLGGGGTLAVWNTAAEANAGTIANGNLALSAGTGIWTNAKGTTITLGKYKAVPGEVLTFSQPVTVALEGDLMKANLTVTDKLASSASYLTVGPTTLSGAQGPITDEALTKDSSGTYTAKVNVTFKAETDGTTGVNATNELGKIGFKLAQLAPGA